MRSIGIFLFLSFWACLPVSAADLEKTQDILLPNGQFATSNGSFTTVPNPPQSSGGQAIPKEKKDTGSVDHHRKRVKYPDDPYDRYPDVLSPVVLPVGFEGLAVNGENLYYSEGVFYKLVNNSEALQPIEAPMDAVIQQLPFGNTRLEVGKTTYYVYNNVYYVRVTDGFKVVKPPKITAAVKEE